METFNTNNHCRINQRFTPSTIKIISIYKIWKGLKCKSSIYPNPYKVTPWKKKGTLLSHTPVITPGCLSNGSGLVWHLCANGSTQIRRIHYDKSYITVSNYDNFIINDNITASILLILRYFRVSNTFQNSNVLIGEKFCIKHWPYFMDTTFIKMKNNSLLLTSSKQYRHPHNKLNI